MVLSSSVYAIQILSNVTRPYTPKNITDCRPQCMNLNSRSEGWYYSCNKTFIKYANCQHCGPACMNARNYFEGWYDSCTGLSIVLADCNKTVKKDNQTIVILQNTGDTRATTTTTLAPQPTTTTVPAECQPTCIRKTPKMKGWFNPCTGRLLRQSSCSHCRPICLTGPGTEGWYDGCNGNFIMPADCGPKQAADSYIKCQQVAAYI